MRKRQEEVAKEAITCSMDARRSNQQHNESTSKHNRQKTNNGSLKKDATEVVRDKADLHNLSQDSGLSHSPVQGVQLSIGQPIKHIAEAAGERKSPASESYWQIGRPVSHLEEAAHLDGQVGNLRRKERRWSLGGLNIFKRREREGRGSSVGGGETVEEKPPPLPPKNTNVFQPSLQVRGGEVRGREMKVDDMRENERRVGRVQNEVAPPIFPHLRPDLQYPEGGGGRLEEGGYYYDPRHAPHIYHPRSRNIMFVGPIDVDMVDVDMMDVDMVDMDMMDEDNDKNRNISQVSPGCLPCEPQVSPGCLQDVSRVLGVSQRQ